MGMQNATILTGATTSFTGGTSVTLQPDSVPVKNGIHLIDTTVVDYPSRPNIFVAASAPIYAKAEKSYANGKKSIQVYFPKVLADGQVKTPSIEIIVRDNPCQSVEEVQKMYDWAIQFCASADFANFRNTGSLA